MLNFEWTQQAALQAGFSLTQSQLDQLDVYAKILVEWNQRINLTAIVDPDEIAVKHFVDSFLLLNHINNDEELSIIDVGTGAGFPSLPCKILSPSLQVTLLDSLNKRVLFLKELVKALGITTSCVHARAEDAGKNPQFREKYDIATARAVAHLRELSEYCLPFVKVGGHFIALKGYEMEQELKEAESAIRLLGGKVEEVFKYELCDASKRSIILIKKISQSSSKYPRSYAVMKKKQII